METTAKAQEPSLAYDIAVISLGLDPSDFENLFSFDWFSMRGQAGTSYCDEPAEHSNIC